MRKLILALALGSAAFGFAGCQTVHTATQAVELANQNVGDFTIADEKGWYYAESLYDVPASAYLAANSRGLFHGQPALKTQLKGLLQDLNRYRVAVYDAYKAGNSVTFHEKLVAMKALSDEIRNLVPHQTSQTTPLDLAPADLAVAVARS